MFFLHKLLFRLGIESDTYKVERFKAAHPAYIVIDTKLYNATGDAHYLGEKRREYRTVCAVTGKTVFFARKKQKLYVALGKTEMDMQIENNMYEKSSTSNRSEKYAQGISVHHINFDAVREGSYRFRFHADRQAPELVYDCGDSHKIYTFS